MIINSLYTETGSEVVLMDQVFAPDRLSRLHEICQRFSPGCEQWPRPDWCVTHSKPRYLFDQQGEEWAEMCSFFDSDQFKQPLSDHLRKKLELSVVSMWADLTGFGSLGPHKEQGGSYMMQVYLTKQDHDYAGTTIYNEKGQILVQLPYRDNFGWFFHGMKVMHGRHHDVPEHLTRFTLQIWFNATDQR